jgi:hypothetical protein
MVMHEPIIQAILAEYNTLRREIENSIRLQHATFGIGIPLLALGLGLSQIKQSGEESLGLQFIVLAIPPFAYGILCLWIVEMARMMRAGNYLRLIEDRLNQQVSGAGLLWENWLRDQTSAGIFDPHVVHRWSQRILYLMIVLIAGIAVAIIAISRQDFVVPKLVFVITYTLIGCLLLTFSWPIVIHSRRDPTSYRTATELETSKEFENWLKRYLSKLGL